MMMQQMGPMGPPQMGPPMAGSMPGTGYDQYLPMIRQRMAMAPQMMNLPKPPPRFPTPGRMDGMRERKMPEPRGPMMSMGLMP